MNKQKLLHINKELFDNFVYRNFFYILDYNIVRNIKLLQDFLRNITIRTVNTLTFYQYLHRKTFGDQTWF